MNFGDYTNLTDLFNAIQARLAKRPKTFTGTKAEWGLLNSTQKAEYQIVNLTDDYDTQALSDTYSTTERVVGRWIDGKPLYEKTFTNLAVPTVTTNGTYVVSEVQHGIANIQYYWIENARIVSSSNVIRQLPYLTNAGYQTKMSMTNTIFQIVSGDTTHSDQPIHATIRYTKTTD